MFRLLLLRHAKAVQDSGEGDFARALTARGRADAEQMGREIQKRGHTPDMVLCSSAARTAETLELVLPALSPAPQITTTKSLYLATPAQLLTLLRKVSAEKHCMMMVGHNPGIEILATHLPRAAQSQKEAAKFTDMHAKFPTCALAVLDFTKAWHAIQPGTGALIDFVKPKDWKD